MTEQLPERRAPRAFRLGRRSITARIVSGVVGLVFLLVVAIGGATYYSLRSFLYGRLNGQLTQTAALNAHYFDGCLDENSLYPFEQTRCSSGPPPTEHEWLIVLDQTGVPRYGPEAKSTNVSQLTLTPAERRAVAAHPGAVFRIDSGSQVLRVSGEVAGPFIVVTGLSTEGVTNTLQRLLVLEVSVGGAAVIVAVLATSWGVQRSLRNLYQVTGTAQEVAAELSPEGRGLDRRVVVTEEGTEVAQLADSLNTLLGAVETQFAARLASEQRMRQFLADASHELRTPLTSIRGYAELARMQRAAGAATDDNLARIEAEGTRMSRLVEDLLLLARGDADPAAQVAAVEPVLVGDLLDDVISNARAAFPGRPIHVQVAGDPVVVADRDQIIRAVGNLVTNAAVHTADGRPITVRAFVDPQTPTGVTIQVIDEGPGLPPEDASHVFERFWRADKARSRAQGGTGLGMAIVAAVVRAHGGTVRFDSSVEAGSTVMVWLPAQPAGAPATGVVDVSDVDEAGVSAPERSAPRFG